VDEPIGVSGDAADVLDEALQSVRRRDERRSTTTDTP
jgi:hypothetical protein